MASPCDIGLIHKNKLQVMTFNAFILGSNEAVDNAFGVLSDGVVIETIHEVLWNKYSAITIDKFGVRWWVAI